MCRFQIVMLVVVAGCAEQSPLHNVVHVDPQVAAAPSEPVDSETRQQIIGPWRSKTVGLDFPIWMVDKYRADGAVITEFYSNRRGRIYHQTDKTVTNRWRVRNGNLEIGSLNADREFQAEGLPRRIKIDDDGNVVAIDTWTRMASGTDHPEYSAIRTGSQ